MCFIQKGRFRQKTLFTNLKHQKFSFKKNQLAEISHRIKKCNIRTELYSTEGPNLAFFDSVERMKTFSLLETSKKLRTRDRSKGNLKM